MKPGFLGTRHSISVGWDKRACERRPTIADMVGRRSPRRACPTLHALVCLSRCQANSATIRSALGRNPRAGAVLIMALVCLVLVAALGGTLVRWAAMEHKLLRAKEDQSQARWLAEAAIERAAAQLAENADYLGDTWDVAGADLPSGQPARVVIHVTPGDDVSPRRTIAVDVEYPLEFDAVIQIHKEVVYQLPAGDKTS